MVPSASDATVLECGEPRINPTWVISKCLRYFTSSSGSGRAAGTGRGVRPGGAGRGVLPPLHRLGAGARRRSADQGGRAARDELPVVPLLRQEAQSPLVAGRQTRDSRAGANSWQSRLTLVVSGRNLAVARSEDVQLSVGSSLKFPTVYTDIIIIGTVWHCGCSYPCHTGLTQRRTVRRS